MTKKEYIELNILKLIQNWTNIATIIGSFVIIALSLLDYFVTPSNFKTFLFYRTLATAAIFVIYLINKKRFGKKIHHAITIAAAAIVATMVALMIAKFGGHQSPYFAGIILTIAFVVGLAPLNVKMCIIASLIIYAIYLIPILIYDTISNKSFFINANVFILSTAFAIIFLRYLIHKRFISEFGLQYDLDQQKKQLEIYSQKLEELVQQRTKELAISEKWHKSIFDNATEGIIVLDKNGAIVNVNKMACELHGFTKEALTGVNIELLETKADKEKIRERISRILNGESLTYETEHYRKDGDKVLLEISANRIELEGDIFIECFLRDITEKKKIQEQLIHSQKMESVGALAGGIAHNFNNILTSILGYAELLLEYGNLDEKSKERVKGIESSARKAGIMISKLLGFARHEAHEILPLNFHDVINDCSKLFEGILDKRIGLKISLCNNNPIIEGDPNQLEQVIMNLVVNARDAMPDGGLITIKTDVVEVGKDKLYSPSYIKEGKYVILSISDTGCGIPKNIIDKIFDPFFTTKEKGKGTGLGLATVYGIVKDHKGYITVNSEVDKGTTFNIYLPTSEKIVHRITKPEIFSVEGNEDILVVDDDESVLNYIKDILEKHGYKVTVANNSLTAIDTFRNLSHKIPLIITDMLMPLMEGGELIRKMKEIKKDVKIIVISGYTEERLPHEMVDVFIRKPFQSLELLKAVRRLLDIKSKHLPFY